MDTGTSRMNRKIKTLSSSEDYNKFMADMAIIKGLTAIAERPPETAACCGIEDKNIKVNNIIDVIQYLEDRYPAPQILPQEPEAKAVAKELIKMICASYDKPLAEKLALLCDLKPAISDDNFIAGNLSAVDLAVLPLIECSNDAMWIAFRTKLLKVLA